MVIGIWCGQKKPSNLNEFLLPLFNEIQTVTKDDISINGFRLNVKIRLFLGDAPATAFLKGFYLIDFKADLAEIHWCNIYIDI